MIKIIHKDSFQTIMAAVNKLVDFVAPTFGPSGNKAIIDKNIYKMVVDDGVQIARDFELEDDGENAVLRVIKETAIKTNDRVGDGTTGSMIVLRAIMQEVAKLNVKDGQKISYELKKAAAEAKEQLIAQARTISSREDIERVAQISFDNPKIAGLIADLLHKLGKEGVIEIENSNTLDTITEHSEGLEIRSGSLSPYITMNPERMDMTLNNPYILLTSYRVTEASDVLPIMEKLIKEKGKREFILIADNVESYALQVLVTNTLQRKFTGIAIAIPQGPDKVQFLEDIALLTGGTVFGEDKGNRLDSAEIDMLGQAEKVVIRPGKTVIYGAKGDAEKIEAEKTKIRSELEKPLRESEKIKYETRLARLGNGVAVIKVGAPTDTETKTLKYKVEDAVNATKSALSGGVVKGAGITLAQISTSSDILNRALRAPMIQIQKNLGWDGEVIMPNATHDPLPLVGEDVIDPVEVLIAGIESAVSIASLLITTHGILVEERPKEKKQ